MGEIKCEFDNSVATVTIANVERLNAITVTMWQTLRDAFAGFRSIEKLRCVVVRGAGSKAFSAGADISEFETIRSTYQQVVRFHEEYVGSCLNAIAHCPVPVIAAVRGTCMGGGLQIASNCDIRIAGRDARFGAPVGQLGFPLAFAETQTLFRLVGASTTTELLLEGRILDAQTAYEKGLVTRVVADEALDEAVACSVRSILRSAPYAARSHKNQLSRLRADPSSVTDEERMEVYAFANLEEYQEGYRQFLRRKP